MLPCPQVMASAHLHTCVSPPPSQALTTCWAWSPIPPTARLSLQPPHTSRHPLSLHSGCSGHHPCLAPSQEDSGNQSRFPSPVLSSITIKWSQAHVTNETLQALPAILTQAQKAASGLRWHPGPAPVPSGHTRLPAFCHSLPQTQCHHSRLSFP